MAQAVRLIAVVLVAATGFPAWAIEAGALVNVCSSPAGSEGDRTCYAYLNGYIDGALGYEAAENNNTRFCIPDGVSTNVVRTAVVALMAQHPDLASEPAYSTIGAALRSIYPCPPGARK